MKKSTAKARPNQPHAIPGTVPIGGPIRLTKWTAPGPVTKHLRLTTDGTIEKVSTAAHLYSGTVSRLECSPDQMVKVLKGIGENDCLSYGVPLDGSVSQIMSRRQFTTNGAPPNVMTRTEDSMEWPRGPAILMVDHDRGDKLFTPNELREALYGCCSALRQSAHIWSASASSCLYSGRKEVRGVEGQRIYIVVADGTDIPRAADVLFKRTWLAGQGYIAISASGQLLVRSILDGSVFQPIRIDFCAPAICDRPLIQRKPEPELFGNGDLALDTRLALPDLTEEELSQYEARVSIAKAARRVEADARRASYRTGRIDQLVNAGVDRTTAERTIAAALDSQVLHADFLLTSEDGRQVAVGQVLADKCAWHGKRFADPLEPGYHNDLRIARAYLDLPGRPYIHSFAHGGQRFLLTPAAETIQLSAGNRAEYGDKMICEFLKRDAFYRRGARLVAVDDGLRVVPQDEHLFLAAMDRTFRFEKLIRKEWVVADAPQPLAVHLSKAFTARFSPLQAVVTAPILVPCTGRLIDKTGYDSDTGLYIHIPDTWPGIAPTPTLADVGQALGDLWWPVRLFPYAQPIDDTIMLTAMLTSVVRPLLPTAPGFAFDAPMQASGKTLLLKVLAALGGHPPAISPQPDARTDDEMRKRLFALLLGGHGVIVIDNIIGEFDSASLAALLTSEHYSDRVLNESRSETVSSRALVVVSGNNLTLKGDLPRRILRCRIDPKMELPHQRQFNFDPVAVVKAHRQKLVAAALTVLRAAHVAGRRIGPGRTASFETWDDFVRQAVCYLANLQSNGHLPGRDGDFPRLVDPMRAIDNAVQEDPARSQLGRLLRVWAANVGVGSGRSTKVSVRDLITRSETHKPLQPGAVSNPPAGNSPSLHDVLAELAGNPVGVINSRSLGRTFGNLKDRVVGGLCLRQDSPYQGAATWWVEQVGEIGDCGDLDPVQPNGAQIIPIKASMEKKLTKVTTLTSPDRPAAPAMTDTGRSKQASQPTPSPQRSIRVQRRT